MLKHLKSDASSGHVDPTGAVAGPRIYVGYLISISHPMVTKRHSYSLPSIGGHSGVSCAKSLVVIAEQKKNNLIDISFKAI